MRRLWNYILRYRQRYILGSLCLLATASMVMAIPALTQRAVDAIASEGAAADRLDSVAWYAGAIIALALAQALVRTFSRALIFNTGRDVEYDLRGDLFDHLATLHQGYYQNQRTGDLMSRMVNDIGAIRLLLGPGVLTFINTPMYCVYAFSLMMMMDVRLTLAAIAPFPIILIVIRRYARAMMDATYATQERLAAMSSHAQETLAGIHVVKSYVREDARAEAFSKLNDAYKDQAMIVAKLRGKMFPAIRTVSSLGTLIVVWYGGTLVIEGRITLGQFVAFIAYLHVLAWPIMALGWMVAIYQRGKAALMRLDEIFTVVPDIRQPEHVLSPGELRGEVVFEGVDFGYGTSTNGDCVLHAIDLTVPAGTSLGILGRTGSGKSTLAALVPRLFDATCGRVLIDGVDVRDWDLRKLRSAVGVVPQDPFLFSSTIEQNIGFARADVPADEMTRLIEMSGLDADMAEFPEGLGTPVGERGVTLSGGQKQRLTLARAIARDPRILILDDALSSVDAATERRILDELEQVLEGRTSILISHRVSSVQHTDRIAIIDDGRLIETGTHSELLAREGVYAELYRRQRLSEELEAM